MNTNDTFGRGLSSWLHEEGEHRVPDHLAEVLLQTAATRQRPWWSSPERWLPMDSVAVGRGANLRPIAILMLIAALLAAALGAAYVASRPPSQVSALAENGRIVVVAGQRVTSLAADGTDPQTFVTVDTAAGLAISPHGRYLAFQQGVDPAIIRIFPAFQAEIGPVRLPDGMGAGDQISWSPDDKTIVFPTYLGTEEYLYLWDMQAGASRLGGDAIDPTMGLWYPTWSPDGKWIAFVGVPNGAGKDPATGDLSLIHPDGTDLHVVEHGVGIGGSGNLAWSPEPGTSKLLFVRNGVEILDVPTSTVTTLGLGFWGTWAPDGKRIATWSDGLVILDPLDAPFTADELVRPQPSFTGACQDHPELAGEAICSMVTWSPDGTRVIGTDVAGGGVLSLPADGKGEPILLDGTAGAESYAWQPVR